MGWKFASQVAWFDYLISLVVDVSCNFTIEISFCLIYWHIQSTDVKRSFTFLLISSHNFKYLSLPCAFCFSGKFFMIIFCQVFFLFLHWHTFFIIKSLSFHRRLERKTQISFLLLFLLVPLLSYQSIFFLFLYCSALRLNHITMVHLKCIPIWFAFLFRSVLLTFPTYHVPASSASFSITL